VIFHCKTILFVNIH